MEDYDGRQIVGMDLHRHRSVLVRMTEDGRRLGTARITNSPAALRTEIARAGKHPRVVLEATYGWYWAADVLEAAGAEVHLAHPLGVKAFTYRRVKNDRQRRRGSGGPAADGPAAGGVDRPARGPRAAGDHKVPAQAGQAAHQLQGPGPRRAGQARHRGDPYRPVRDRRAGMAGQPEAAAALCREGHLAAPAHRRADHRDHHAHRRDQRPAGRRPRLPGHPAAARHRPGAGRGDRGRDRRHHPVPQRRASCARGPG